MKENVVTTLVIWKRECSMPQSAIKFPHLIFDQVDILSQEPFPPPNLSTPLSIGINLYQQLLWERAQWKLEREKLKHFIDEKVHQLKKNLDQNEILMRRIEQITRLILEIMECRSPSPVYALFLKEQLVNFKLTRIVEGLGPSISTSHEFYDAFQSIPMPLNNFLCELYLHNLVVPNDTEWNSLLYVGDV